MHHHARRTPRALTGIVITIGAALARAQSPAPVSTTLDACYVPASGTVYRIDTPQSPAPGAPKSCLTPAHAKFTWNQQGPAGPVGPTGPQGAKGDPGTGGALPRNAWGGLSLDGANGFAASGTFGSGNPLGATGAGSRLLWIPAKAAFRAGYVNGSQWDEASIGPFSLAAGFATTASGAASIALGYAAGATEAGAVAIGSSVSASGAGSVALGSFATNGYVGSFVYGDRSTYVPMQSTTTNEFAVRAAGGVRLRTSADLARGCDISGSGILACTGGATFGAPVGTPVVVGPGTLGLRTGFGTGCTVDNVGSLTCTGDLTSQAGTINGHLGILRLRAAPGKGCDVSQLGDVVCTGELTTNGGVIKGVGKLWLRTGQGKGCDIDGAGNVVCSGTINPFSDVRRKTAFGDVDGDRLLAKLAAMPVRTWRYKTEPGGVRHMGPTAQDFRAAFALGTSDTTIATVDADGVALAAVKALERRSRAQAATLSALREENRTLRIQVAALREQARDGAALRARVAALADAVARLDARRAVAAAGAERGGPSR